MSTVERGVFTFEVRDCVRDGEWDDLLCEGAQVCYTRSQAGWINDLATQAGWNDTAVFPSGNEFSVCGCNTFFGFFGNACLELSPRAIVNVVTCSLLILGYFCMFAVLMRDLSSLIARGRLKFNAAITTLVLTLLATLSGLLMQILWIATLSTPAGAIVLDVADPRSKYGTYEVIGRYMWGVQLMFTFQALVNVGLFWLEIVRSTSKMSTIAKGLAGVDRKVIAYEVAGVVAIVPCLVTSSLFILALLAIPFMGFVCVVYIYASKRLLGILEESRSLTADDNNSVRGKKAVAAIGLIRQTTAIVVRSAAVALVGGASYGILQFLGWRKADSVALWLNNSVNIGLLMMQWGIGRYTHLSLRRTALKSEGGSTNTGDATGTYSSSARVDPRTPTSGGGPNVAVATYAESDVPQ